MKIKFWGVRGSIPCPGPNTVKYGGNTACLELRIKKTNRLIIIDAGSGIKDLGNYIVSHDLKKGPIHSDIFFTHTHWDHIMGFPFFTPIYIPTTKLKIYGPVTYENDSLIDVVGGQLTYRYFPVRQAELASNLEYIDIKEDQFEIGDGIRLTTKYLNHPVTCLGYRFEYEGKVFCTAYDTEPFQNVFCTDPNDPSYDAGMAEEGANVAQEENERLEQFFKNADLLVIDAQYTEAEYKKDKLNWGHCPMEHAIKTAQKAGVKRVALFHHEPVRTDDQLDELTQKLCTPANTGAMNVFFAKEGMEIDI